MRPRHSNINESLILHSTECSRRNATNVDCTYYCSQLHLFVSLIITPKNDVYMISWFRCHVDDICALLGYYAALIGSSLPTFRDNLSVPSSRVKSLRPLKMVPIGCPETSLQNYHTTLRNIPDERRSQWCWQFNKEYSVLITRSGIEVTKSQWRNLNKTYGTETSRRVKCQNSAYNRRYMKRDLQKSVQ
jgi:hypothetical protein